MPHDLVYVSDSDLPGIRREAARNGFRYRWPDGSRVTDADTLERIRRLAIPPAYRDVWICPIAEGHLQATGRDARGRKQYRYHAQWNAQRNADKYSRLVAFGNALSRIRRRVARDLASDDGRTVSCRVVLASLVRILDTTFVRIGNEAYARENHSYGLTSLRSRHAGVERTRVRLTFRGKHGIRHEIGLEDRRLVRIIRRCKQLPGQELFQYEDAGSIRHVGSADVNDYLAQAAGERFTAKDFRTWHGSVEALEYLRVACADGADGFSVKAMVAAVAKRLGNTLAVCRKAYIHPEVLALGERVAQGAAPEMPWEVAANGKGAHRELRAAEIRLLDFLTKAARKPGKAAARRILGKPGASVRRPDERVQSIHE